MIGTVPIDTVTKRIELPENQKPLESLSDLCANALNHMALPWDTDSRTEQFLGTSGYWGVDAASHSASQIDFYRKVKQGFMLYIVQQDETVVEDIPIKDEFTETITNECKEFCESHRITSDLAKCLSQAKVIFSNIWNLAAEYECFPADEYEEEGHIVIKLEVDSDQDTVFSEYDAFVDWMSDHIDDQALDLFILSVNRTE